MLRILGRPSSINVRKVLWTCDEIGVPHESVASVDAAELLSLNPNAMVPVLLDGDTVVWDSNTICRYLADAHWNRHMTMLDAQLRRTGADVAGHGFTLADVVVGLSTHRWMTTPIERPLLPAVQAHYDRLAARPAFRRHARSDLP